MPKFKVKNQEGVVLFICLVMLLLLTLLGVSSIQTTSLEQVMARNAVDSNLAFQAAEAALLDGENYVEGLVSANAFDAAGANASGLYDDAGPGIQPNWLAVDWEGANFRLADTTITGVVDQPKYIVERVTVVVPQTDVLNLDNIGQDAGLGRTQIFRVTARGEGATVNARAAVQSTYGRRF